MTNFKFCMTWKQASWRLGIIASVFYLIWKCVPEIQIKKQGDPHLCNPVLAINSSVDAFKGVNLDDTLVGGFLTPRDEYHV